MGQKNSTHPTFPTPPQQPLPKNPPRDFQPSQYYRPPIVVTLAPPVTTVTSLPSSSLVTPTESRTNNEATAGSSGSSRGHYTIANHHDNAFYDNRLDGPFKMSVNPFTTTPKFGKVNDYAFTANVMKPGDNLVVMATYDGISYLTPSLGLGFTSRNPHTLLPRDIPQIDPNDLLDRPEYWALDVNCEANWSRNNNEFCISFEQSGVTNLRPVMEKREILMGQNGGAMRTVMHVDTTVPLWAFFILHGSITRLHLRGKIRRPIDGFKKAPETEKLKPNRLGLGSPQGIGPDLNLREAAEMVPIQLREPHTIKTKVGSVWMQQPPSVLPSRSDSTRTKIRDEEITSELTRRRNAGLSSLARDSSRISSALIVSSVPFLSHATPIIRNPPTNPFRLQDPPTIRIPPLSMNLFRPRHPPPLIPPPSTTSANQNPSNRSESESPPEQNHQGSQVQSSRRGGQRGGGRSSRRPNRSPRGHHLASGGRERETSSSSQDEAGQTTTQQEVRGGRGRRGFRFRGNGRGRGGSRGGAAEYNSFRRDGDWTCPNEDCANSNFGWRVVCHRCGIQKPDGDNVSNATGRGGRAGGGGRWRGRSESTTDDQPIRREEPEENGTEAECIICCEKKVDSVFLPCGHMCMDMDCATAYWSQQDPGRKICPICRADSTGFIRTFTA